jgi:ribosomal protein S6--L-glutamate ligase
MSPTVTVLTERRYCEQAQPRGLIGALRRAGARTLVVPDDRLGAFRPGRSDVVVARGRSRCVLGALRAAEAAGVPTVDRPAAIAAVRDKAAMAATLAAAGLPAPRTWCGAAAAPALPAHRRFVVKPRFGDNGRGVAIVSRLRPGAGSDEQVVVQEYIENDGADCKLYVIGRQVWVVRKPSPISPCRTGRLGPVPVTAELRDLALACGDAFGLSLYGVDCVQTPTGPLVIEVNDFPNFTAVPGADQRLAAHVLARGL